MQCPQLTTCKLHINKMANPPCKYTLWTISAHPSLSVLHYQTQTISPWGAIRPLSDPFPPISPDINSNKRQVQIFRGFALIIITLLCTSINDNNSKPFRFRRMMRVNVCPPIRRRLNARREAARKMGKMAILCHLIPQMNPEA